MNAIVTRIAHPSLSLRVHRSVSESAVGQLLDAGEKLRRLVHGAACEVECVASDVRYGDEPRQLLDIYAPRGRRPLGTAVYIHGGGFRLLSRRAHASVARRLAECGWIVFAADYRRAPEYRYPFASMDASVALAYARRNAALYGAPAGGPTVLAGESAGAHIALSVALAASMPFDEPWARRVYEWDWQPDALILGSGLYQLTAPDRYDDGSLVGRVSHSELRTIERLYLGDPPRGAALGDMIDTLRTRVPARPLPALFAFAGTADPLVVETEQLCDAFASHGAHPELHVERGAGHSYHAWQWTPEARRTWGKITRFSHHVARRCGATDAEATSPRASNE